MKTKLLRKFRKRFLIREDQGHIVLFDLQAIKVYDNFASGQPIQTRSQAFYLGIMKIVGTFQLLDYLDTRRKRLHRQRIRKLL